MFRRTGPCDRTGAVMAMAPLLFVILIFVAAMMVDFGSYQAERSSMQNASDAAALAAIMRIGDTDSNESRTEAFEFASAFANHNQRYQGDVLTQNDLEFGTWDQAANAFSVPNSADVDAIRVTVVRGEQQSNFLTVPFLKFFGFDDVSAKSSTIATLSSCSSAKAVPVALRSPNFGEVIPELTQSNPNLDGPSVPDANKFKDGDEVVVMMYGHPKAGHLTVDIGANGSGASSVEVRDILSNRQKTVRIKVGDTCKVFSQGADADPFATELVRRLQYSPDSDSRTVVLPIIEELPSSRDSDGRLVGDVRVGDFAPVYLDRVEQRTISDPDAPWQDIQVDVIIGRVKTKLVSTDWGGKAPSGVGGKTLRVVELVD